jgi:hypothetical protein
MRRLSLVIALVGSAILSFDLTAQAPAVGIPRMPDGKPNLNGIWEAGTPEANWNIEPHAAEAGPPQYGALFAQPAGVGIVDGPIPYQPSAAAKKKENYEKRFALDPEAKCYMPGVPRATYMPFPFQIIQGTNKVLFSYAFAHASRIATVGRTSAAPVDSWMGWSNARWDGNTLVVDVTGLIDQTWFDRAGNFHSDALHVTERYTMSSRDIVLYEATIDDPKVFTRPWKIALPLFRRLDRNAQVLEFHCVPFAEEMMYGHLTKKSN